MPRLTDTVVTFYFVVSYLSNLSLLAVKSIHIKGKNVKYSNPKTRLLFLQESYVEFMSLEAFMDLSHV